jgi:hypothetical protein
MKARIKKVMVKVRKEQETEMKQAFMKEKGKEEVETVENFSSIFAASWNSASFT